MLKLMLILALQSVAPTPFFPTWTQELHYIQDFIKPGMESEDDDPCCPGPDYNPY